MRVIFERLDGLIPSSLNFLSRHQNGNDPVRRPPQIPGIPMTNPHQDPPGRPRRTLAPTSNNPSYTRRFTHHPFLSFHLGHSNWKLKAGCRTFYFGADPRTSANLSTWFNQHPIRVATAASWGKYCSPREAQAADRLPSENYPSIVQGRLKLSSGPKPRTRFVFSQILDEAKQQKKH